MLVHNMFVNNISHWIIVVMVPKLKKVLYFDSLTPQQRDLKALKEVLNE